MSTVLLVVVIVVAVILLVALVAIGGRRARERRLRQRRLQAAEHRERAAVHGQRAERERAEAVQHEERARELDPDVDERTGRSDEQPAPDERHRASRQDEDRPHRLM